MGGGDAVVTTDERLIAILREPIERTLVEQIATMAPKPLAALVQDWEARFSIADFEISERGWNREVIGWLIGPSREGMYALEGTKRTIIFGYFVLLARIELAWQSLPEVELNRIMATEAARLERAVQSHRMQSANVKPGRAGAPQASAASARTPSAEQSGFTF